VSDLHSAIDQLISDRVKAALPPGRLRTRQLAEQEGVHPQTVRAWVRRGCPCLMVGRSPRFLLSEVEAWLLATGGKGAA